MEKDKMADTYLTTREATDLVEAYIQKEEEIVSVQEILDAGTFSRLKDYGVRPGKVSDCISGGVETYLSKETGQEIMVENSPLESRDGIPLRFMIRTPRISTHDLVRGHIPFKDQILALNHNYMRKGLMKILGTSQFDIEGLDDNSIVIVAENLTQLRFENVLRAYMAVTDTSTSLYVHYTKGKREFCGHVLPDDLVPNGPLPYVMDTPSTKSDEHDESLSSSEIIEKGICTSEQYTQLRNSSLVAYGIVTQFLSKKGIIAVDTKTEHGINTKKEIVVQDEVWTMDSSRFWLTDDYDKQWQQLQAGEINELKPKSYSKEFARKFSEGDQSYDDEQRIQIAVQYILGIQLLLEQRFEPDMRSREERIVTGINTALEQLVS